MAPGEAAAGSGAAPGPAFPLSDQQRLQLREAFDLFDADGSGQMDVRGLKARGWGRRGAGREGWRLLPAVPLPRAL